MHKLLLFLGILIMAIPARAVLPEPVRPLVRIAPPAQSDELYRILASELEVLPKGSSVSYRLSCPVTETITTADKFVAQHESVITTYFQSDSFEVITEALGELRFYTMTRSGYVHTVGGTRFSIPLPPQERGSAVASIEGYLDRNAAVIQDTANNIVSNVLIPCAKNKVMENAPALPSF